MMPWPTTTIRWAVAKAIIDQLREKLGTDVQVEGGYPGDTQEPDSIWVGIFDGTISIPVMTAGRKERDDQFDIPFIVSVRGRSDLDETMTRVSELVAVIEDILANDPSLGGGDGTSNAPDPFPGVLAAEITSERMTSADIQGTGRVGTAEVVVSVHARLE